MLIEMIEDSQKFALVSWTDQVESAGTGKESRMNQHSSSVDPLLGQMRLKSVKIGCCGVRKNWL